MWGKTSLWTRYMVSLRMFILQGTNISGQIIATSHGSLTPNGGLVREIALLQGNLGWWNSKIWPEHIPPWKQENHLQKYLGKGDILVPRRVLLRRFFRDGEIHSDLWYCSWWFTYIYIYWLYRGYNLNDPRSCIRWVVPLSSNTVVANEGLSCDRRA